LSDFIFRTNAVYQPLNLAESKDSISFYLSNQLHRINQSVRRTGRNRYNTSVPAL